MSVFPLWYAPAVPPPRNWGRSTQIWGHAKKISGAFAPEFVPPNFKTVSAPMHKYFFRLAFDLLD